MLQLGNGGRAAAENRGQHAEAALQTAAAAAALPLGEATPSYLAAVARAAAAAEGGPADGVGEPGHEAALRGYAVGGQGSAWDICKVHTSTLMFHNPKINRPKYTEEEAARIALLALADVLDEEARDPGAWAPLHKNKSGQNTWPDADKAKLLRGEARDSAWLRGPGSFFARSALCPDSGRCYKVHTAGRYCCDCCSADTSPLPSYPPVPLSAAREIFQANCWAPIVRLLTGKEPEALLTDNLRCSQQIFSTCLNWIRDLSWLRPVPLC